MPQSIHAGNRPYSCVGRRILFGAAVLGLPGLASFAAAQDAADAARPACAHGQHWDADMAMCMGGDGRAVATLVGPTLMLHVNQFAVASTTSGPRGLSRVTGPGTWMLMLDAPIMPRSAVTPASSWVMALDTPSR